MAQAEAARALFWRLKANGVIMMGISSYQEFPGAIRNPFDDRHTTAQDQAVYRAMDGWLHCFRCAVLPSRPIVSCPIVYCPVVYCPVVY